MGTGKTRRKVSASLWPGVPVSVDPVGELDYFPGREARGWNQPFLGKIRAVLVQKRPQGRLHCCGRDPLLRGIWHLWILRRKKQVGAGTGGVWGEEAAAWAQVSVGEASSIPQAHELKLEHARHWLLMPGDLQQRGHCDQRTDRGEVTSRSHRTSLSSSREEIWLYLFTQLLPTLQEQAWGCP